MNSILLLLHSTVRYFVLIFLVVLIVRSFLGWTNKKGYTQMDDKVSLWLFMLTHTQLLLGIILYFVSPAVIFNHLSMKVAATRYWLVEHGSMMLVAIVLISVARISIKKVASATAKHKRLFTLNTIALVIIIAAIAMSGRGFFNLPNN